MRSHCFRFMMNSLKGEKCHRVCPLRSTVSLVMLAATVRDRMVPDVVVDPRLARGLGPGLCFVPLSRGFRVENRFRPDVLTVFNLKTILPLCSLGGGGGAVGAHHLEEAPGDGRAETPG